MLFVRCMQTLYLLLATLHTGRFAGVLLDMPWPLWAALVVLPPITFAFHIGARRLHAKRFDYEMLARRLKFNTRLGMFSPR